jgi:hypothetical protein
MIARNFRSVRQMIDPRLEDLDARFGEPRLHLAFQLVGDLIRIPA